ncbi:MAG: biopolymer transporter ExbD [Planctomycetes bacterium]|nr:biopolymer transporter ExbD [Planctomycetota bacterium]
MRTRNRRQGDKAMPDLTPMIDVTFQLLIFFILCSKFAREEQIFRPELPKTEGSLSNKADVPKEPITIYCSWDPVAKAGNFTVALAARDRRAVPDSHIELLQCVHLGSDSIDDTRAKQAAYRRVFNAIVATLADYERRYGDRTESFEISFARDAQLGAASGTAPWAFVTLAIDATSQRNKSRVDEEGREAMRVNFKFADSLGRHQPRR